MADVMLGDDVGKIPTSVEQTLPSVPEGDVDLPAYPEGVVDADTYTVSAWIARYYQLCTGTLPANIDGVDVGVDKPGFNFKKYLFGALGGLFGFAMAKIYKDIAGGRIVRNNAKAFSEIGGGAPLWGRVDRLIDMSDRYDTVTKGGADVGQHH